MLKMSENVKRSEKIYKSYLLLLLLLLLDINFPSTTLTPQVRSLVSSGTLTSREPH